MMGDEPVKSLINETYNVLKGAISDHIDQRVPAEMRNSLENDVFVFSGMKTYASLKEASSLLLDEKGNVKSNYKFQQDILKIDSTYNKDYLDAEKQFATSTAQMAAKWVSFEKGGDRYNLQFRTANDDKVRASHRTLNMITLPFGHSFWDFYITPLGWKCRCTVVQVLKGKYEESDGDAALEKGDKATTIIGKDGKNVAEIFRFNPGKQKVIFPPNHPYNKTLGAKAVKAVVEKLSPKFTGIDLNDFIKGDIPTNSEMKEVMRAYATKHPDDFRNGLDDFKFLKSGSYMMQHSMSYKPSTMEWSGGSRLSVSTNSTSKGFNPADELKGAFGAMKNKQKLSFNQEYAVESLWHEILHAKTKTLPAKLTDLQTKSMETINQFCARHTYPEFMERFGAKATNKKEVLDKGYGYSTWVTTFREDLKTAGIEESQAVSDLMPELMKDYKSLNEKKRKYLKQI